MTYGKKPELVWIDPARLTIDLSYQRSLETRRSKNLIANIVQNFRWPRFGAILVAEGGLGAHPVLDGQHRVEAARRLGLQEVPCLVIEAPTVAEQARAFLHANQDRVAVTGFAIHHAQVAAGDPAAVLLDQVVTAADVQIPRYPIPMNKLKPRQCLSIKTLGHVVARCGPARATEMLTSLRKAYPATVCLHSHVIQGLGRYFERQQNATAEKVTATLSAVPFPHLLKLIDDRKFAAAYTRWEAARDIFFELIDGGRKPMKAAPARVSLLGALDADRRQVSRDQLPG